MNDKITAQFLIDALGLEPHPEGGYYREVYRSTEPIPAQALPDRYRSARCFGTAIYYLLDRDAFSAMHRIESDEIFHLYSGGPVEMLLLYPDMSGERLTIGADVSRGQRMMQVVPAGTWQGLCLAPGVPFALLGTTVAPGFEFEGFTLGNYAELATQYLDYADDIRRLTR